MKKSSLNPIPTGCCHVTLIYGLIPPMAGRNRVKIFYMTHKFDSEVSLHFWLLWPTVRRALAVRR